MTPAEALAQLERLAALVVEDDPEAGASRLLERVAAREDAAELRDALVLRGARAVIDPLII